MVCVSFSCFPFFFLCFFFLFVSFGTHVFNSILGSNEMKWVPFHIVEGDNGGVGIVVMYKGEKRTLPPEFILGVLFGQLGRTVQSFLGTGIGYRLERGKVKSENRKEKKRNKKKEQTNQEKNNLFFFTKN